MASSPSNLEEEEEEMRAVMQSRAREAANVMMMEATSIRGFGDQLIVVGLWTIVEQYCGRSLRIAESRLNDNPRAHARVLHRWHSLKSRFATIGVDLVTCKSYEGVEECRVLNNKIKHLGIVDNELSCFANFNDKHEESIDEIPLNLQYYSDSVFEFVGCMLEVADGLLGPE
jgi:hypothetical protein